MAKQTLRQEIQSDQERGYASLLTDVLDKIDERFSELDTATQEKFLGAAAEVAKLQNDLRLANSNYAQRFAMAVDGARQGSYKGPFRDASQAANFGRLIAATVIGDKAALADLQRAGVSMETGPAGGALVRGFLADGVMRNVETYGVFARSVPPTLVGAQSGSMVTRTGGLTVYHPDLGSAATQSAPSFGRINFSLNRWSTLSLVDRWFMESDLAVALGDFIATEIAQAIAYCMDLYGFMGDGTSTYARIVGAFKAAGTNQLVVTGDAGDDTFAEMIAKSTYYLAAAMGKLPVWAHAAGPRWYMHLSTFFGYLGVRDTVGRPIAEILAADRPWPFMLMGYPVEICQLAPSQTAASTVFAVFGALARGWRVFRHRQGLEVRSSDHYKFAEGQIAIVGDVAQDIVECDNQAYVQIATHS